MTAKEYLERIQLLDERISQKMWELEDIERNRTLVSAVNYSKERLSGGKLEMLHLKRHRISLLIWFGSWNFIEFLDKFRNYEVIGNIFDNPELLEGGDK